MKKENRKQTESIVRKPSNRTAPRRQKKRGGQKKQEGEDTRSLGPLKNQKQTRSYAAAKHNQHKEKVACWRPRDPLDRLKHVRKGGREPRGHETKEIEERKGYFESNGNGEGKHLGSFFLAKIRGERSPHATVTDGRNEPGMVGAKRGGEKNVRCRLFADTSM